MKFLYKYLKSLEHSSLEGQILGISVPVAVVIIIIKSIVDAI